MERNSVDEFDRPICLDYNATTPHDPEVIEAALEHRYAAGEISTEKFEERRAHVLKRG